MKQFNPYFSYVHTAVTSLGGTARLEYLRSAAWRPPVDIYEREDSILVIVELPGVDKEEISITVEENLLKITGVRPKTIPESTQHVHQMEIPYGRFARTVQLPSRADVDHIEAKYNEGYLTVEIPRSSRG